MIMMFSFLQLRAARDARLRGVIAPERPSEEFKAALVHRPRRREAAQAEGEAGGAEASGLEGFARSGLIPTMLKPRPAARRKKDFMAWKPRRR
jgi:hypothetical protein